MRKKGQVWNDKCKGLEVRKDKVSLGNCSGVQDCWLGGWLRGREGGAG